MIVTRAHPRAGLLGNPSDLYGGRGVGFAFSNFSVELELEAGGDGEIAPDLVRVAWEAFCERCGVGRCEPFTVRLATDIPRQAGLAGSSAIVIAALRAFSRWCSRELATHELAELALHVENDRLGIRAGPMDRLVQAHEGLVAMDFARPFEPESTERLDTRLLPPLLIAIDPEPGQPSGQVHAPVWERYQAGDPDVREVMREYRPLVERGLGALLRGDLATLMECVNHNFDLRARLFTIGERDALMIALGRDSGGATKFCGSGGAVLAVAADRERLARLHADYQGCGFTVILPEVVGPCA